MLSKIATAALLGVSVSAAPWGAPENWPSAETWGRAGSEIEARAASGQQAFKFPLANGFPNPNASSLAAIEKQAHGTLPNGAFPKSIGDDSAASWQLIAFNEIFEVAYFTSLLQNITNNEPGYEIKSSAVRNIVLNALTAVQGQEQLHALGANTVLKTAGRKTVAPCEYVFPVNNFESAIALASTFTDVVLGTLQEAQASFSTDDNTAFIPIVGAVIGQEGEQDGVYRAIGGKIPSALPFLTRSTPEFAYSVLNQMFVVPGSCPATLNIPIFDALSVPMNPQPKDQTLTYSFKNSKNVDTSCLSLVYINQQNTPIVEKISNIKTTGQMVSFTAPLPYTKNVMNGLTIAAVTTSAGPFASPDDVAKVSIAGPGIIEIN